MRGGEVENAGDQVEAIDIAGIEIFVDEVSEGFRASVAIAQQAGVDFAGVVLGHVVGNILGPKRIAALSISTRRDRRRRSQPDETENTIGNRARLFRRSDRQKG